MRKKDRSKPFDLLRNISNVGLISETLSSKLWSQMKLKNIFNLLRAEQPNHRCFNTDKRSFRDRRLSKISIIKINSILLMRSGKIFMQKQIERIILEEQKDQIRQTGIIKWKLHQLRWNLEIYILEIQEKKEIYHQILIFLRKGNNLQKESIGEKMIDSFTLMR